MKATSSASQVPLTGGQRLDAHYSCWMRGLAIATGQVTWWSTPWLLSRLGRDPAYGSGPLVTVIQDLVSITVYLFTALAFA